jgi:hypothetical protein
LSIHLAARYTQLLTWQCQRTKERIEAWSILCITPW